MAALVVLLVAGVFAVRGLTDIVVLGSSSREFGRRTVEGAQQNSDEGESLRQQAVDEAAQRDRREAAARLARAREAAPSQITVEQMGCYCTTGRRIVVTCRVASAAQVPVAVEVAASAQTGFFGITSKGTQTVSVGPRTSVVAQVETKFRGVADCSSAAGCSCNKMSAAAQ